MLSARDRLLRRATQPRLVSLYRALTRLRSTVTVMHTGAHPDDEQNGMLACLRHQHGARIIIACSTRGEGGQSAIGPERLGALGVIRSRELEEAARVIDADIAWLGQGPEDAVHDFGFSKSGKDTLSRWGEDRTIDRLVRAYREFRPDIVIPTFLDVPGQHGHHRAMTEAAERAIALAADPAYITENLAPWKVSKYYLPAWSGGGDTYDDEVPPPPKTTAVVARSNDFATGMSYERLGEVSRTHHASQMMGFWKEDVAEWPLHRVNGGLEQSVFDDLPSSIAELGPAPQLAEADQAIASALAAYPHTDAIIPALIAAKKALIAGRASVPSEHTHRIERKLQELDAALASAAGIDISASLAKPDVTAGNNTEMIVECEAGSATDISAAIICDDGFSAPAQLDLNTPKQTATITAAADAPITNAYHPDWLSLGGNGNIYLDITANVAGETVHFTVDTEEQAQIAPAHAVALSPEAIIAPLGSSLTQSVTVKGLDATTLTLATPAGVTATLAADTVALSIDADLPAGRHTIPLMIGDREVHAVTPIAYPHIGRTRFVRPQTLDILSLDLIVPQTRVGYVSGGVDNVRIWLERMGANVTAVNAEALSGDLSGFDTIVIGVFAFGQRPDLLAAAPRLHAWVRNGGHLVSLYHRPSDGWTPDATPPLPLTIGSPSLRWRVTNPSSLVDILDPTHPLFAGPNVITATDFDGWDKERGLYFASSWDIAYTPLLSMNDAGEKPLLGSLLSAEIEKGRHTHTSLVLHHQLDKLVPGAFRLMANLLQAV